MSDCLITKLKGSVSDASLQKLGVAEFQFKTTSASMKGLRVQFSGATKVTTDYNCTITNSSGTQEQSSGKEFTIPAGSHFIKPDSINQVVTVSIWDKYTSIEQVGTNDGEQENGLTLLPSANYLSALTRLYSVRGAVLDLDLLAQSTMIAIYIMNAEKITGHFSSLNGTFPTFILNSATTQSFVQGDLSELLPKLSPTVSQLNLLRLGMGVTGDISDIDLPLTTIAVGGTGIGGNIEGFLENLYAHGKNCNIVVNGRLVKLNGSSLGVDPFWYGSSSISDGVLTLMASGGPTFATYDGNSWTYA